MIYMVIGIAFCGIAVLLVTYGWLQQKDIEKNQAQTKLRLGVMPTKHERVSLFKSLLLKTPFKKIIERGMKQKTQAMYERDLPACLEVVALGMQAGMGFDQAFSLYTERFNTPLAKQCQTALSVWQKGLKSRDAGLRELAQQINTPGFKHFSFSALRALRFGAPMAPLLLDLAEEARKEYRASRQELVSKAPVKMLLPTGVLILPAMLLLVMGPIILDLLRNMG